MSLSTLTYNFDLDSRKILTEDILKELKMEHYIDDTSPNPLKLKIIDKLEKCLLENWNFHNTNPNDMIPGLFISTDKLSKQFDEETRRIEKIIFQVDSLNYFIHYLVVIHTPSTLQIRQLFVSCFFFCRTKPSY